MIFRSEYKLSCTLYVNLASITVCIMINNCHHEYMKLSNGRTAIIPADFCGQLNNGRNPELVFLIVVFFNSTDLAVVIPNSTAKKYLFFTTTS